MHDNVSTPNFASDDLALKLADYWVKWDAARTNWKEEKKELRDYLFATSTRDTTNAQLPWKNSTVTPKLTQIRDNLHANYMAALFPNDSWFTWESHEKSPNMMEKREAIIAYMQMKLKASNFQVLVSQLVYDYIDYGNVFATHEFLRDVINENGKVIPRYTGPKAYRICPTDVVMNPLAESFERSPVIRRMLKSLGDLVTDVETKPSLKYDPGVVQKVLSFRQSFRDDPEMKKDHAIAVDGFGSFEEYMTSDMCEIIEFWGDVWDEKENKLLRNQLISVVDRKWILRKVYNEHWTGQKPIYHCGWRLRPNNLWAAGPLDQLVGLQYRVDHLENLKADVFDLIAYPVQKIKGITVEAFAYEPGVQIFCGEEGDVDFLRPDSTALNADMQIDQLMNRMEELAGAPKQAMGIRTPGEKTAYEVQQLENAAGRIFQSKVQWFEKNILEPLLNGMLADAIRNIQGHEQIMTVDAQYGTPRVIEVTREDLSQAGKLYPMGARHFADKAKFVQELNQTMQAVQAMPSVQPHLSGKNIAKALEDNLGWKQWNIVQDNVAIMEQTDTQRLAAASQENLQAEQAVSPDMMPGMPPTQ